MGKIKLANLVKYVYVILFVLLADTIICCFCPSVFAAVINVPADYPAIQEAINAAGSGDTVMAAQGTYVENITIKSGVILQGAGPNSTTIDGNNAGNVVTMESGSEIREFSIVNGKKEGEFNGILCLGRVVIRDNDIHASTYNGIYGENIGDTQIINNIIHGYVRRGIETSRSSPVIEGNIIYDINVFTSWYAIVTITDSLTPCSPIIRNNTIVYNDTGINTYNTSPIIENNIIMYNQKGIFRPASYSSYTVINRYNDVYENGSSNYENITPGEGSISVDPLFVSLEKQDFSLQAGSPCINAGNPSAQYNDKDGSRNDMGAYGGPNGMQAQEDIEPPITSIHNPAKDKINVDKKTNITIHICDSLPGVDLSTARIVVEGQIVYDGIHPADYPNTNVSGDKYDSVFVYDPPSDFEYGQIVDVTVNVSDLAGNVMPQEAYSFTITPKPENLASWQKEIIDSSLEWSTSTAIVVDSKDKIHINYLDGIGNNLKYITNAGGNWVSEVITADIDPMSGTTIGIDPLGRAHVVYTSMDETGVYLNHAVQNGAVWDKEVIFGPVMTLLDKPSMAIDSNSNVHIAYIDVLEDSLKYADNSTGKWVIQDIDTGLNSGYGSSIGIDTNGKAHIAYSDNGGIKYTTNLSGKWVNDVVDSTVGASGPCMAIDSQNKPHVSYCNSIDKSVKYAVNISGVWMPEVIADYTAAWVDIRIALDSKGKTHIVYWEYEWDYSKLKYISDICGFWNKEDIEDGGKSAAIAVDSNDNVHISYSNFGLKYAYGIYNLTGDVNQDKRIDVLDAQCAANQLLGMKDWGSRADVNKDGSVNVVDIQLIVNIILGM